MSSEVPTKPCLQIGRVPKEISFFDVRVALLWNEKAEEYFQIVYLTNFLK